MMLGFHSPLSARIGNWPHPSTRRSGGQTMEEFVEQAQRRKQRQLDEIQFSSGGDGGSRQPIVRGEKVGRNDPCPCGSGRKYKKCCGAAVGGTKNAQPHVT